MQQLINADRWAIYLFSEAKGFEGATLEAIAVRTPNQPSGSRSEEHWRRMLTGEADLPSVRKQRQRSEQQREWESSSARRTDSSWLRFRLSVGTNPGVIEGIREGKEARAFKNPM
jgi:hypothetical protein